MTRRGDVYHFERVEHTDRIRVSTEIRMHGQRYIGQDSDDNPHLALERLVRRVRRFRADGNPDQ